MKWSCLTHYRRFAAVKVEESLGEGQASVMSMPDHRFDLVAVLFLVPIAMQQR